MSARTKHAWGWSKGHPWYQQVIIGLAFGVIFGLVLSFVIDRADGAPIRHHTSYSAPQVSPQMHTCDDPNNPCYTADQMQSYWYARTHKFYHLNPAFRFPKAFVQAVVYKHNHYCKTHPSACVAQRQHMAQVLGVDPQTCTQYWQCQRQMISCAGGSLEPYWSCNGAWKQTSSQELGGELSHTQKVVIACGGGIIFAFFGGLGAVALGTGGAGCFWATWMMGS